MSSSQRSRSEDTRQFFFSPGPSGVRRGHAKSGFVGAGDGKKASRVKEEKQEEIRYIKTLGVDFFARIEEIPCHGTMQKTERFSKDYEAVL